MDPTWVETAVDHIEQERACTLRDSFRASFSVGEGQSFSTPLNILDSDWRRELEETAHRAT